MCMYYPVHRRTNGVNFQLPPVLEGMGHRQEGGEEEGGIIAMIIIAGALKENISTRRSSTGWRESVTFSALWSRANSFGVGL